MKLLLLILQIHKNDNIKETIKSFLDCFKNKNLITETILVARNYLHFNTIPAKIIKYETTFFDLKSLESDLTSADYVIYIDDDWIFNKKIYINDYVKLLERDQYQQIFFNKNINNYKQFDYDDQYYVFDSIKQIFLDQNNKFKNNNKEVLDSHDYANHEYANSSFKVNNDYVYWPHFKLLPSVINSKIFKLKSEKPLCRNLYLEKYFANSYLSAGYKSHSIDNVKDKCVKNETIYKKEDNLNNITIVTGYISIKKTNFKKHGYNYLEKSIPTLSIPQNMILFVSEDIIDHVTSIRTKLGLMQKTKIITVTEKDLYMYEHLGKISENVKKNNKIYNKAKYVMAVNVRYNYVRKAIKKNYFGSDYFAWIDFSANHIVEFPKNFKFSYNNVNKIRTSWIARYKKGKFHYNHKCIGGGIFMGHKDIMVEFIKLHDEFFLKCMNMGYNMNDDKLLWLIFEKHPELFNLYFASYGHMLHKI